jgi:hypothetical protein
METLFDIITLLLEVGLLLLNVSLNLVGHLVGQDDCLDILISDLNVGLHLEHHQPFD